MGYQFRTQNFDITIYVQVFAISIYTSKSHLCIFVSCDKTILNQAMWIFVDFAHGKIRLITE